MKAISNIFYLPPLCALLAAGSAHATNGYFPHGFGVKAMGMGGASVAMTDNAFAGTNNPAIAAWAGNRAEGGLTFFSPKRSMSRTGSPAGLDTSVDSGSTLFYVPEFGYNRAISDKIGVGVTVYGNGGMNTDYPGGQLNCGGGPGTANALCGTGGLGVDLMQLIVAPTLAYKLNDRHSVGISPLLVFQQFEAHGLQAFSPMSSDASKLTGGSYSHSTGFGVRLGYLGKLNDQLSLGASYSPKINMSEFDDYAGLFAGGGGFDIPENYTLGLSFQATPAVTVALDYSRINYGGVPSIANPSTPVVAPLGAANGPGFGWRDINVWKLGVQWQASTQWTLRAGLNVGDNPIQSRDVTFNILAPGVMTKHLTLGGSYALSPTSEVSFSYMYAPENSVSGSSFFGDGSTETIRMKQQSIGIQYGWHWK